MKKWASQRIYINAFFVCEKIKNNVGLFEFCYMVCWRGRSREREVRRGGGICNASVEKQEKEQERCKEKKRKDWIFA